MGSLANYVLVFSINFLICIFVILLFLIIHEIGHMIFYRIFLKIRIGKLHWAKAKKLYLYGK